MIRTLYPALGRRQAVQDETGKWWMRYLGASGRWSRWAPFCGIGRPKGLEAKGKQVDVKLPIDKE